MKPEGPVARKGDYGVVPVPLALARELLVRPGPDGRPMHYAGGASNTAVYCHGLVKPDGELVGAAIWLPPPAGAAKWVSRLTEGVVPASATLALSRLVVAPDEPQNAAGLLLGASVRLIASDRQRDERRAFGPSRFGALVTYADRWQEHAGTIYKATGWTFAGETVPHPVWTDPATGQVVSTITDYGRGEQGRRLTTSRSVDDMLERGYVLEGRFKKLRFVKILWYDDTAHSLHGTVRLWGQRKIGRRLSSVDAHDSAAPVVMRDAGASGK